MDFVMPEVTFNPTYNCTLKCRLCGNSVPYMHSDERVFPLEEIQKSIDCYFKIVSHVKLVTISGGEPLLFPQLAEVINCIKKHMEQTDGIRMVTSGTVIPDRRTLDAMQELENNFIFLQMIMDQKFQKGARNWITF